MSSRIVQRYSPNLLDPMHLPHQLTANVKLLQKIALIWQGQVLLLQRSGDSVSRPHCWDLAGGNSEWPTAPDQAGFGQLRHDAVQEVEEETGIHLAIADFAINEVVFLDTFYDQAQQLFSILIGWRVPLTTPSKPAVQISREHTRHAWMTLAQTNTLDFGGQKGLFILQIVTAAFQK